MTCLYCTTELPIDGSKKRITCPKCGTEQVVNKFQASLYSDPTYWLSPYDPPAYGENERYDSPENY